MKIPLTQGQFTLVDRRDFQILSKFKWRLGRQGKSKYAIRNIPKKERYKNGQIKRYTLYLHHSILGKPSKGNVVDHINGNGLDNRRKNLRICSVANNVRNQKNARSSTGLKGVTYFKRTGKFYAKITYKRKCIHLGYFTHKEDAYKSYIKAARKYFGKFSPV